MRENFSCDEHCLVFDIVTQQNTYTDSYQQETSITYTFQCSHAYQCTVCDGMNRIVCVSLCVCMSTDSVTLF